jgi:hypothetical protein
MKIYRMGSGRAGAGPGDGPGDGAAGSRDYYGDGGVRDEMISPLTFPPSEIPGIRGLDLSTKIPGNPDNSFFSVPVENTPLNRSVYQNKGEMHLS